jgi:hypothetical protein
MLSLSTSLATGMPKGCTNKKPIYYQYVMSIYGAKKNPSGVAKIITICNTIKKN